MTTPDWAVAIPNIDSLHTLPPRHGGPMEPPFTWPEMQLDFAKIMQAFVERIALALGWVGIPGGDAFQYLIDWGIEALQAIDQALRDAVSGLLSGSTLADVINRLQHLAIGDGKFDAAELFNILNIPQLDNISVPGLAEIKDAIHQALTSAGTIGVTIEALIEALKHIPGLNVLGIGGPASSAGTFQETWNQLVAGFVGTIVNGNDAGLADLFNVIYDISSRATRGLFAFDIAGIRNNSLLNSGFFATTQSNVSLEALAFAGMPTFPITQSTAITAYHRIEHASDYALVSWQGYGVTNITDCYVNIYKMDITTGINNLVHASPNIVGLLTGGTTATQVAYDLATAVHVEPGEVFGIEITIRGTGTHNIAGSVSGLQDQLVFPRRYSSVRNSGTSGPPSTFTPTYGNNVPFIEFGVTSGLVGLPHSPSIVFTGVVGTDTLPVPLWANIVQVQALGPGGGGRQGGTFGLMGQGGSAGGWATAIWTRGTDFTGTPIITRSVTPGGVGGSTGGSGGTSTSTTVSIPGHAVSAPAGAGGTSLDLGTGNLYGRSPGSIIVDEIPYVGGAQQNTSGSPGGLYGGGGSGGNDIVFQFGGPGAPGAIWLRFKS